MTFEDNTHWVEPFTVYYEDPRDILIKINEQKHYAVDQAETVGVKNEVDVDWTLTLSETFLDGRFLEEEATYIVVNEDPRDNTFTIESYITPVAIPLIDNEPSQEQELSGLSRYRLGQANSSEGLAMNTYEYYSQRGIQRLGKILETKEFGIKRVSENILSVSRGEYMIHINFGGEDIDREEIMELVVPNTVEYQAKDERQMDIVVTLFDSRGNGIPMDDDEAASSAIIAYVDFYSNLIKALYEEHGLNVYPAQIIFDCHDDETS